VGSKIVSVVAAGNGRRGLQVRRRRGYGYPARISVGQTCPPSSRHPLRPALPVARAARSPLPRTRRWRSLQFVRAGTKTRGRLGRGGVMRGSCANVRICTISCHASPRSLCRNGITLLAPRRHAVSKATGHARRARLAVPAAADGARRARQGCLAKECAPAGRRLRTMERAPRMARRRNEKTNEREVHVAVHLSA